jgi:hypothetical protein
VTWWYAMHEAACLHKSIPRHRFRLEPRKSPLEVNGARAYANRPEIA